MAETIFDIAGRFQRKIAGDVDYASSFGNRFIDNFENQAQIAENLSQTELNDLNNRFGIRERRSNWDTDLESSNLNSRYKVLEGKAKLEDFDFNRNYDKQEKLSRLNQFEMENKFKEQRLKNEELRLQSEALSAENDITSKTYDRQFEQLKASIPNYAFMPAGERYLAITQLAKTNKVAPNVMARINDAFVEENSDSITTIFDLIEKRKVLVEKLRAGADRKSMDFSLTEAITDVTQATSLDQSLLKSMVNAGIITNDDAAFATATLDQLAGPLTEAQGASPASTEAVAGTSGVTQADIEKAPEAAPEGATQPAQATAPVEPTAPVQQAQPVQTQGDPNLEFTEGEKTILQRLSPSLTPRLNSILRRTSYDADSIDYEMQDIMSLISENQVPEGEAMAMMVRKFEILNNVKNTNGW